MAAFLAVGPGIGLMVLFILMAYFAIMTAGSDPSRLVDLTTASLHTLWFNVPVMVLQEVTAAGRNTFRRAGRAKGGSLESARAETD